MEEMIMDNNNLNENVNVQPEATFTQATTATVDAPVYTDAAVAEVPAKGLGIAALILGILAVVCCWTPCFGLIVGIVGLILSIVAKKNGNATAMPTVGLILSIISVASGVLAVVGWILWFIIGAGASIIDSLSFFMI